MVRCWLIGFCSDTYSDICGRVICQTAIRELHLVFTPVRGRGAVGDTGRHAGGNCADIKLDLLRSMQIQNGTLTVVTMIIDMFWSLRNCLI